MASAVVQQLPVIKSLCLNNLESETENKHASAEGDAAPIQKKGLQIIWKWNHVVPRSVERCIDELIEERTRAHPMATAVCAWDGDFTYGELDQLATHLCKRLLSMGIGPDNIVPLCFEKSRWMTVAMLAIIKTGAAFFALDPTYPERRLVEVVSQVNPKVLLSSTKYEALGFRLVDTVVSLSQQSVLLENPNDSIVNPTASARTSPSSILYVIFTSGSTGTPKGVVIEHRQIASAIHHQADRLDITASSRFYDFASYSYDVSISNTLAVLVTGGCICTPSDQDRLDNVSGSIKSLNANITAMTPSIARLLAPETVPGLRTVILVGEPARAADLLRWKDQSHAICRYGVSESPAASTINESFTSSDQQPTIGTAAGLVTWIVDPNDHNVLSPQGAIGELLLEGPSISRAYLNDPKKTAAAYIHDPKWLVRGAPGHPGRHGRLYKTGDLVRYAEDGSIIYVGRKDNQVKVNGQRLELGDIEHHIQECLADEDQQVVVELITLPGKNPRPALVAFVQQRPSSL